MSNRVLCRYFVHGTCKKGDSCHFSHDWNDRPNTVCAFYQRGICSYGDKCRYDHVKAPVAGSDQQPGGHSGAPSKGAETAGPSNYNGPEKQRASERTPSPSGSSAASELYRLPSTLDSPSHSHHHFHEEEQQQEVEESYADGGFWFFDPETGQYGFASAAAGMQMQAADENGAVEGSWADANGEGHHWAREQGERQHEQEPGPGWGAWSGQRTAAAAAAAVATGSGEDDGFEFDTFEEMEDFEREAEEFAASAAAIRMSLLALQDDEEEEEEQAGVQVQEGKGAGVAPQRFGEVGAAGYSSRPQWSEGWSGSTGSGISIISGSIPGVGGHGAYSSSSSCTSAGANAWQAPPWNPTVPQQQQQQQQQQQLEGLQQQWQSPHLQPWTSYDPNSTGMHPSSSADKTATAGTVSMGSGSPISFTSTANNNHLWNAAPAGPVRSAPLHAASGIEAGNAPSTISAPPYSYSAYSPHPPPPPPPPPAAAAAPIHVGQPSSNDSSASSSRPLCAAFSSSGSCPQGESCTKVHGEQCHICGKHCLHPHRDQEREEHLATCERSHRRLQSLKLSSSIECSICLEPVLSKGKPSERRFGILSGCDHPFCVMCIRSWRGQAAGDGGGGGGGTGGVDVDTAIRACPICRVPSHFVTPSIVWFSSSEEKEGIIEGYKKKLKDIDCRHFDFGEGQCPFGISCFYKHVYRDGRTEETHLRHLGSADGSTVIAKEIRLSDFLGSVAARR